MNDYNGGSGASYEQREELPARTATYEARETGQRFNRDVYVATERCWEAICRNERPQVVVRGVNVGTIASCMYRAREALGQGSERDERAAVRAWCAQIIWPIHYPAEKFPKSAWYSQEGQHNEF